MKSYSEREIFGCDELSMLEMAQRMIAEIPDEVVSIHPAWRCHELARAVVRSFCRFGPESNALLKRLRVVDGKFGRIEHSWIAYKAPADHMGAVRILDVYCVARLPQVQLIDCFVGTEILNLYKPGHWPRTDVDEDAVEYLVQVWEMEKRQREKRKPDLVGEILS